MMRLLDIQPSILVFIFISKLSLKEYFWKCLTFDLTILVPSHLFCVLLLPVEDIKNKFKNLRTTFQRQYKLVRLSGGAGLVPQWKHFQQLSFLQGCCEPEEGADETPPSPPAEENWLLPASPGLSISFLHSSSSGGAAGRSLWTDEREREVIAFYAGE